MSHSSRSSLDSITELDPLKAGDSYKDETSAASLRSIFDTEKFPFKRRRQWRALLVPTRMCCGLTALFVLIVLLILSAGGLWAVKVIGVPPDGQSEPWYPSPRGGTVKDWSDAYRKAHELVFKMTLVEKVNITTGTGWMMGPCVGNTGAVYRLGFPALCLQDGPLGLRFTDHTTAFPAGITVGATWNKSAMYERGKAHGLEARGKGVNVILGPSMGPLGKLPAGGRNWEGFGPDPVLAGMAAYHTIKGIQDQGVMATAKHYIANEQEHFRQSWEWGTPNAISSNIDDRTLHELYAWPFSDSVRAGVASVMCSYNQVNNSYACQNSKLLNGILKDELGFQGFVQSDWLAQRSGVASALAGLDMSMPGDGLIWQDGKSLWGAELTKAVLNGTVPVERLDDMVLRIVAAWFQLGQDDQDLWPYNSTALPNFSSWTNEEVGKVYPGSDYDYEDVVNHFVDVQADHHLVARNVAEEGIVLVKNKGLVLPMRKNGFDMTQNPARKLRIGLFGEAGFDNPDGPNACRDRACNDFALGSGWGSGAVEFPYLVSPASAIKAAVDDGTVDFTEHASNVFTSDADHKARFSDICIVFITADSGEGYVAWQDVKGDRNNLRAQKGGDDLVKRTAAACGSGGDGPVIVVLHNVGPVIMEEWIDIPNVNSVLVAHLPGQESGNALARIMFGDANPSGRLPYTIAKREEDYGEDSRILKSTKSLIPQQNFTDQLYIDYRHFDKVDLTPRFEFGYGLSYSNFSITKVDLHSLIADRLPYPAAPPRQERPPMVDRRKPAAATALMPDHFYPIKKFVYPWLNSVDEAKPGPTPYPYPEGYSKLRLPSAAGGAQGGNPDLYTPVALAKFGVENLGPGAGAVVIQLYVSFPGNVTNSLNQTVDFPVRQLRAFEKLWLEPGAEGRKSVTMELTRRDLSFWDVGIQNWVMPPEGDFKVSVGLSSRNFLPGGQGVIPFPPATKGAMDMEPPEVPFPEGDLQPPDDGKR